MDKTVQNLHLHYTASETFRKVLDYLHDFNLELAHLVITHQNLQTYAGSYPSLRGVKEAFEALEEGGVGEYNETAQSLRLRAEDYTIIGKIILSNPFESKE